MDLNEFTCISENKPPSSESTTNNSTPLVPSSPMTVKSIDINCWTPENKEDKKRYDRNFLISLREKRTSRTFPDVLNAYKDILMMNPNQMMSNKGSMQSNYNNYNKNKFGGSIRNESGYSYDKGSMNKNKQKGSMNMYKMNKGSEGDRHQSTVVINLPDEDSSNKLNYGNLSENSSQASSNEISTSKQHSRENSQSRNSESPSWGSSTNIAKKGYTEDEIDQIEKKPQDKHEEVFREVRNILNKLTRQNFVKLTGYLINLPINNEDRLKGLVEIIYEDSIYSEIYTEIYANICKVRNLVFMKLIVQKII
jgi:hypothetical protein